LDRGSERRWRVAAHFGGIAEGKFVVGRVTAVNGQAKRAR